MRTETEMGFGFLGEIASGDLERVETIEELADRLFWKMDTDDISAIIERDDVENWQSDIKMTLPDLDGISIGDVVRELGRQLLSC